MNILDEIVLNTKSKLEAKKLETPLEELISRVNKLKIEKSNFKENLVLKDQAIIAEIKKASPSAGIISEDFNPVAKAKEYESFGASALSILTEEDFFLGSIEYLIDVKAISNIPILRKDFIVDEYQIYESKLIGADCILLIVSILSDDELNRFTKLADSLGLDFIIEVHDEEELTRIEDFSNAIIGVNNRDLKTFEVNIENSIRLRNFFKKDNIFVAESGIKNQKDIDKLSKHNINVFLIGESLMKGDFF
jgi:indole-3-glycerol phosphate synthase|tara:strand:- start:329 stop:1078 length:750 start_codon:yes stop_codon:yes gene_type:complete